MARRHGVDLNDPSVRAAYDRVDRCFKKVDVRRELHYSAGLDWMVARRVAGSLVWQEFRAGRVRYDSECGVWVKL